MATTAAVRLRTGSKKGNLPLGFRTKTDLVRSGTVRHNGIHSFIEGGLNDEGQPCTYWNTTPENLRNAAMFSDLDFLSGSLPP